MTASPPYEFEPAVLVSGAPDAADHFLVSVLWGEQEDALPVAYVMNWARLLHERGDDFSSHAAACHYWLFEHYRGDRHQGPAASV
ncbi:hypothetical protein AB4Y43_33685 [Paraburkholderia sp. BR10872]|uniref:hypothetical protein n=1 Tax=Paraburkholderia sp. BR10872 TaxID=3236989 RepID=UPI0034D2F39A